MRPVARPTRRPSPHRQSTVPAPKTPASLSSNSEGTPEPPGDAASASSDTVPGFRDTTNLARNMFDKAAVYLQGELEGTSDEYELLEKMNEATTQRYADMEQVTKNIAKSLVELNDAFVNLNPYLEQIKEIERSSHRLEEAAYALDAYVKTLEQRFKTLEKRT